MKHRPYRIVVLVPELPLELGGRKAFLRARQQVHRDDPVPQRQLAPVHHRVAFEALPIMALPALETLLVVLPVMTGAPAVRAHYPLPLSVLLQLGLAVCLIRKPCYKVY